MKRVILFLLTNLAVLVVLGVVASVLGVDRFLTQSGLNLPALLGFAGLFGMGGSFLSLLLSKWMAKRATGAVVIEEPRTELEHWLVQTVARQAQAAGIGMPEVAIYQSDDVNAFATGATKNSALVAVSTGLLERMSRDEAEAVLGHEVSHVANGDMVTLALLQGVLNTFVIFVSRAAAFAIESFLRRDDDERSPGGGGVYFVVSLALQLALGVLASLVVAWFSRYREFRADAGGANLAGRAKMIGALRRLRSAEESELPQSLAAFGIAGGRNIAALFRSHPPLDERIARLASSAPSRTEARYA